MCVWVGVAEVSARVFNAFGSSTEVFAISAKSIRLLCNLVQNAPNKNRKLGERFLENLISSRDIIGPEKSTGQR